MDIIMQCLLIRFSILAAVLIALAILLAVAFIKYNIKIKIENMRKLEIEIRQNHTTKD